MMIVKPRKFRSLLGAETHVSFVIEAVKICGFEHTFDAFPFNNSVLNIANELAAKMGWNPDTALVMAANTSSYRILMLVNNITLEELVKQTKRLFNLKVFL